MNKEQYLHTLGHHKSVLNTELSTVTHRQRHLVLFTEHGLVTIGDLLYWEYQRRLTGQSVKGWNGTATPTLVSAACALFD